MWMNHYEQNMSGIYLMWWSQAMCWRATVLYHTPNSLYCSLGLQMRDSHLNRTLNMEWEAVRWMLPLLWCAQQQTQQNCCFVSRSAAGCNSILSDDVEFFEYLHQSPNVQHEAINPVKSWMLQLLQNAAGERERERKLEYGTDEYELRPCCMFYPNKLNTIK